MSVEFRNVVKLSYGWHRADFTFAGEEFLSLRFKRIRTRKTATCAATGSPLVPGDYVYRPETERGGPVVDLRVRAGAWEQ